MYNNWGYLTAKWGSDVCALRTATPPYINLKGSFRFPFDIPKGSTRKNGEMMSALTKLSPWKVERDRRMNVLFGPDECIICDSHDLRTTKNKLKNGWWMRLDHYVDQDYQDKGKVSPGQ